MKLPKAFFFVAVFFICNNGFSQTLKGTVLNAKTKAPIESATIYFDNTTLGVTTNLKGEFTINYTNAIKSPLVISFLGFKKQIITDYRTRNNIVILLEETTEALNEVVIYTDDGLTRKQKLRLFKKEFLGTSSFGKSCKILNEDDIIMRYNKNEKTLTAHSKVPLQIENKALQYLISYDLMHFVLRFKSSNSLQVHAIGFYGTTYFRNSENIKTQKALRNRLKAYRGSRLKFMRALYKKDLTLNKFEIYNKSFKANPWDFFKIEPIKDSGLKEVTLNKKVNILYNKIEQSAIEFKVPSISIDFYGNYTDPQKVIFSGVMANQRIGELLPFDYGL